MYPALQQRDVLIVIILCMLLCIPLLAFNIFQFDYRADGLVAVQAMAENGASKEAIQSSANVILNQEHTKDYVLWFKVNKQLVIKNMFACVTRLKQSLSDD